MGSQSTPNRATRSYQSNQATRLVFLNFQSALPPLTFIFHVPIPLPQRSRERISSAEKSHHYGRGWARFSQLQRPLQEQSRLRGGRLHRRADSRHRTQNLSA